jgi:hypothetical protein
MHMHAKTCFSTKDGCKVRFHIVYVHVGHEAV